MDLGTVWPLSFSDGGHDRSPSDIVGNSELPLAEAATGFLRVSVTEQFP